MVATPESFLALRPHVEAVDIEGFGKVNVRGLTAKERDDYEQTLIETGPDGRTRVKARQRNVRASLVVRCLVDDSGERWFKDTDIDKVGGVDGKVIDQVWDVARRLSGMDAEAVEEAAAGFDSAQDDGSSSE